MKLAISDLRELALVFALANTPLSLLRGMRKTSAVEKLRQYSAAELAEYYDHITARPGRSEFVMALAYAVLCAILLRAQQGDAVAVDATRLLWGERMREHLEGALTTTTRTVLSGDVKPEVRQARSLSSPTRIASGLFGPDGQPVVSWRNS